MERARAFAEILEAPLAVIEKRRQGNLDKAELLNVIGEVKGKRAIIVDDEIDTAGTLTEMMMLVGRGHRALKFFPAEQSGGAGFLKAVGGPLPGATFCPTGGISEDQAADYLRQPNVACIGGSWMVPKAWLQAGEYDKVRASAARARAIIDSVAA